MDTTAFLRNQDTPYKRLENCHGGEGRFGFRDLLAKASEKQLVKFVHDDVLPPGSSIGNHQHGGSGPFEEWYLCLSGNGIMTLDGEDHAMGPGDISVCRAGGNHGIRNTGDDDMRIIVIAASLPPA